MVRNDADQTARVLMFSSITEVAAVVYPVSDKISIWTTGGRDDLVVKRTSAVDCWDGERAPTARLRPTTSSEHHRSANRQGVEIMEQATDNRLLSGRCECGATRYRVADEFLYATNCHCSNCRAATGSAFKPFAGIERDKLEIIEGQEALLVWGDDKENHTRCGICGSLLYSIVRDGGYVHVALGSLADNPSIRPSEHIFVGSSAPWFEITDDLPQAEEY